MQQQQRRLLRATQWPSWPELKPIQPTMGQQCVAPLRIDSD